MRHKLLLVVMFGASIASAETITVTLDTSPLQGDIAGPFSLAFQLTDGSGTGDGNNTVTLSHFQFGSGGPSGAPTKFGGVIGDVGSTVTLVDTSFLNALIQPFTPGTTLGFTAAMTNNVDDGGIPDGFAFSISDNTGQAIPTQAGPFADMFLSVAFDSSQPSVGTFAGDVSRSPAGGGGPISIAAPTVSAVPEPGSFALTVTGFGIIAAWRSRRRR